MQGKTIVVTGAFGTLGRAAAMLAASRGAKVAMVDVAVRPDNPVAGALALAVDLTKFDATTEAMRKVREATGRIDAVLNIAGGFVWQTVADGDELRAEGRRLKAPGGAGVDRPESHRALPQAMR